MKKYIIAAIALAAAAVIAVLLFMPHKAADEQAAPTAPPPTETTETETVPALTAAQETQPYIIVEDNEYGGKAYRFTLPSSELTKKA